MGKNVKNDNGFSVVELLLVVIIVILVGFMGWYVYHTDHKSTANTTTSSSTSNNSNVKYFSISQWGVRAPYGGDLTLESGDNTDPGYQGTLNLGSTQLDASDPECTVSNLGGGVLQRISPNDMISEEGGTSSGLTATQWFAKDSSTLIYAHVGNYYYQYIAPQGACSNSLTAQDLQIETFKTIIPLLQAIPSS